MSRNVFRWLLASFVLAAIAYGLSGVVVVAPGEVAVVRRFGRALARPLPPGPHWLLPAWIDRITRVRTDTVRRLEVGLVGTPGPDALADDGEYITGDLNMLRASGVVQYRVSDPIAFTLRAKELEPILTRLIESTLSRSLARVSIDLALRSGRAEIAREMEGELSQAAARYGLGISILGVSLTEARPPVEVAPDFASAQAAQSERDGRIREAQTYEATALTGARASALATKEKAKSRADRSLALAKARAARFETLLAEASGSRRLTIRRLYLDTLRELWPKAKRKIITSPDEPVDLSILDDTRK